MGIWEAKGKGGGQGMRLTSPVTLSRIRQCSSPQTITLRPMWFPGGSTFLGHHNHSDFLGTP
eukprot:1140889-Pelagomonas_calceolata.AAC.4